MIPIIAILILEAGWIPNAAIVNYEPLPGRVVEQNDFYLEANLNVSLYGFYVEGTIRNIAKKTLSSPIEFAPCAIWYNIEAGWGNDILTVGWNHECDHPIATVYYTSPGLFKWEGGWNEIFARVTLRMSQ